MYEVTDSTRITGVDWNEGILTVQFKDGATYDYQDVDIGLFQEFLGSVSKGKFFQQEILGKFEYSRRT